jgi:hypothetical protein
MQKECLKLTFLPGFAANSRIKVKISGSIFLIKQRFQKSTYTIWEGKLRLMFKEYYFRT